MNSIELYIVLIAFLNHNSGGVLSTEYCGDCVESVILKLNETAHWQVIVCQINDWAFKT